MKAKTDGIYRLTYFPGISNIFSFVEMDTNHLEAAQNQLANNIRNVPSLFCSPISEYSGERKHLNITSNFR